MVLVSAMHITAGVWVNDDEPGIQADTLEWLDKIAPPSWKDPSNEVAHELLPEGGDYRHHRGGEDNGDAHLKNLLVHQQVVLPITDGQARPRPLAGRLLLRVRRPPLEAAGHQGHWRIAPSAREGGVGRSTLLVLGAILSVQLGAAAATTLFDEIGPAGTVFYRLLFAAIVLLAIWRPRRSDVSGRPGARRSRSAFGFSLAAMNFSFYEALDRIPLGIAVTLEFVGPLGVALWASRRRADVLWVALAAAGVVLLAGPTGSSPDALGVVLALVAGRVLGLLHPHLAPGSGRSSRAAGAWRWRWPSAPR